MWSWRSTVRFWSLVILGLAAWGCGSAERASPESAADRSGIVVGEPPPMLERPPAPATFAEGVAKLIELRDAVRKGFAENNVDQAHPHLHEVGHLLELLPELFAKGSNVEADRDEVKKSVDGLFDHFGKVDERLHGETGASYDDVSKQIDIAIETLRKHLPR